MKKYQGRFPGKKERIYFVIGHFQLEPFLEHWKFLEISKRAGTLGMLPPEETGHRDLSRMGNFLQTRSY